MTMVRRGCPEGGREDMLICRRDETLKQLLRNTVSYDREENAATNEYETALAEYVWRVGTQLAIQYCTRRDSIFEK